MSTLINYRKYLDFSIEEYRVHQLFKLKVFVTRIKNRSKFYKEKLTSYKKIENYDDFQTLPILNQNELRSTSLDFMRATDWRDILTISSSSGTTGKSKLVLWTNEGLNEENKWITLGYSLLGVNSNSRLALMMPLELSRVPSYLQACRTIGAFSIPFGRIHNDTEMDNCIEKIKLLGVTHIHCSTSRLLAVTNRAKELGYSLKSDFKIKYLLGGALYVSDETRKYLQTEWGAEFYDTCGANEVSFIGAECSKHNGLHILPGINYIEVVDQETKRQITDNKSIGEILITNFANLGTPLLRYRIGDLGIIDYRKCKCGLSFPRLYIKGRAFFTLSIGGTKLNGYDIDKVLARFPNITNNYQAIIEKKDNIDYVKLKIECLKNATTKFIDKRKLIKALGEASYEILLKVQEGKVNVMVDIIPFGTLKRTNRDKIKNQIIDKRVS